MQTPGLTMEPPSVPVSHYKSGVTRSARDNGPARPIKRRGLLPRVKGGGGEREKPSTSHSLTLWLGKAERAEAASRFPRLIHPPSHKVSIVYSSAQSTKVTPSDRGGAGGHQIPTFQTKLKMESSTEGKINVFYIFEYVEHQVSRIFGRYSTS